MDRFSPLLTEDREDPPDREKLRQRARILLDMQHWREALALLQDLADTSPEDHEVWEMVSEAFSGLGDHERALRAADLSIQSDPYSPEGHLAKCRVLLAQDEKGEALQAARQALELTHYHPDSRRMLVRMLLANGRTDEAAAEIQPLSAQYPDDPEIASLQGEVLRLQGHAQAADAWFRYALAREPACAAAWAGQGELHKSGNRVQMAAESFYQAARADPLRTEYRSKFVEQIDALVQESGAGYLTAVYFSAGIIFSLCALGVFAPAILPVLALLYWTRRPLREVAVSSVLRSRPPHLAEYYRIAKPLQDREDAALYRWGCGLLLVVAAVIGGIVYLSVQRLWEHALRVLLVALLLWLGRVLSEDKKPDTRAVAFRFPGEAATADAEEEDPADPLDLAWGRLARGDAAGARKVAEQILSADPENARVLSIVSLAALAMGEHETAVAVARQGRTLEPDDGRRVALVWYQLAAAGQSAAAAAEARAAPDLVDDSLEFLVDLIHLSETVGASAAVRPATDLVLEIAPHTAEAYALSGALALAEKRPADAEVAYREALAREPESALYLTGLGTALVCRRRFREGWKLWDQALQLDPTLEAPVQNLTRHITLAGLWATGFFCLVLAAVGLAPTLMGRPRNDWMPWISWLGPLGIAGAGLLVHRIATRVVSPVLARLKLVEWTGEALSLLVLTVPIMFAVHAVQAWFEIALHPALFHSRWPGAATITFLALYLGTASIRFFRQSNRSEAE